MKQAAEQEKERQVYVVAKSWMYKKGKSMWSGWKHRFFVYLSNRELWYYETDHGMSVLGVVDLTKATEVRATSISDAPTKYKHAFEIVTPSRIWKICPDVEDPEEEEIAVERGVSLLTDNEAYSRVQHRGKKWARPSTYGKPGSLSEETDKSIGETKEISEGTTRQIQVIHSQNSNESNVNDSNLTLASPSGQVIVTETTSWAKMSGNVRIDVLSESPWSAQEIAMSLVSPMMKEESVASDNDERGRTSPFDRHSALAVVEM